MTTLRVTPLDEHGMPRGKTYTVEGEFHVSKTQVSLHLLFTELEAATLFQISPEQVARRRANGDLIYAGTTTGGVMLFRRRAESSEESP